MLYTLRATDEQMQWFRDAKYGMFLHRDPSSLAGIEISWDREAARPADIAIANTNELDLQKEYIEGGASKACVFDSVTSDRFRLNILSCMNVTIYEFQLFDTEAEGSGGDPGGDSGGDSGGDNLAFGKSAEASSVYGSGFEAAKALDRNDKTRCASATGEGEQILTIDLGEEMELNRVAFKVYADKSNPQEYEVYTDFKIQYEKDGQWVDAYDSSAGTHQVTYPVFDGTEKYGQNGSVV